MGRAIVLIACLLAAGVVAGYTHYSERKASQTPVYTVLVPQRAPEPPPAPSTALPPVPAVSVPPPPKAIATPGDRASLARELQRELKRVGCYSGEINGVWTTSSRMAMKAFTDKVNATLPIDNPDYILLSLVQQRQEPVCGTPDAKGVTEAKAGPQPGDKTATIVGAAVPAAAAVTALTAVTPPPSPPAPKVEPQVVSPDAVKPAAVQPPPKANPADPPPKAGGPVPPARVYGRRSDRYANRTVRPPRVVRNFLRALGFR